MRGKDINLTVQAGSKAVRVVRFLKENGEAWGAEDIGVTGSVWDMRMEEKVGDIECKVTEEGSIELTYPALGIGRYIFVVDGQSDDGERERILEGYIGYEGPATVEGEEYGEEMVVMIGGEVRKVLFGRNSAWERLYEETNTAKGEAEEAAESAILAKDEALLVLKEAQAFIESFNEAVRSAITIGVNGNWWIGGEDTGSPSKGANGLTPSIGDDGYWYIGGVRLEVKAQGENGLTPYIGANGNWCIGAIDTGVEARGRNGVDGTAVRRILVQAFADIPWVGDTCNGGFYYYVPSGEEYEVYAWLEPDGWVKVGLANDIATKEIHGLVKLGTDALADGAPVGLNADGGLAIPTASASVSGSGKLGTDATVEGAPVGLNASKAYTVGRASVDGYGTVKLSSSSTLTNGGLVGTDANGRLAVDWATDSQAGVVKVGRIGVTENEAPFAVTVVRTTANTLAFNCLTYGALQSRLGSSFYEAMGWVGDDIEPSETYVGLLTSEQFSQDSREGLVLLDATNSRSGGVYVTSDYLDERDNAVLAAKTVLEQRSEMYDEIVATYRRIDDSYSQSELADLLSTTLELYYTANDVDEMVNGIADNVYTKAQSDARYVQQSEGSIKKIATMYKSEFDQLITRDANTIYFVKRDL